MSLGINWEAIAPSNREKLESLLNAFETFVSQNHPGPEPQDRRIVSEWDNLKQLIKQAPTDTQAHNKHINALRSAMLKEEVSRHLGKMGEEQMEKETDSKKIEIDKGVLLSISR